jgi:anti-sigma B factor antagonist
VLRVRGEIDAKTAPELRDAIARLAAREAGPLIMDLDEVAFIGSPALAVLIDANKEDPDLRIVCTNRAIPRIFEIAGLHHWLRLSPSLQDALAEQKQPPEEAP